MGRPVLNIRPIAQNYQSYTHRLYGREPVCFMVEVTGTAPVSNNVFYRFKRNYLVQGCAFQHGN